MLVDAHVHLNNDHEGSPVPALLLGDVAVEQPEVNYVLVHLGNRRLPDSMCVRSRAGPGGPSPVSREHKPDGLVRTSESSSRSPPSRQARKQAPRQGATRWVFASRLGVGRTTAYRLDSLLLPALPSRPPCGFSTEGDTEVDRSGRRPKGRPQEGRRRIASIDASPKLRRLRLEVQHERLWRSCARASLRPARSLRLLPEDPCRRVDPRERPDLRSGRTFVSAPCFRPPEDGETYADDVRQPWLRDTAEVLYKNDNVYADISGLVLAEEDEPFAEWIVEQVEEAIAYIGDPTRQLLYGSDWPLCAMGPYVDFLDDLELGPEAREALAWRTASEVFDIPLDAAA